MHIHNTDIINSIIIRFCFRITELSLIESRFDIMNPPRNLNDASCMLKRWSESLLV